MLIQLCFFFLVFFSEANGKFQGGFKWYNPRNYAVAYRSVLVDLSGHGNFSSVQSAIDSVPSNNKQWVRIYIKAGIYWEKVKIPYDKPYILLKGEGKRSTQIIWDDHDSTAQSPTFMSMADNIIAKGISFVNSYNYPPNDKPRVPAVAAMITGDKSAFYRCRFSGYQDTLWDDQGRHYFQGCTIEGAVDFIFGSGQSLYQGCAISVLGQGFITAQGRTNPNDANGFVFKKCSVFGNGISLTFLGRPWRSYARVVFYNSRLSNVVQPRGWDAWNFVGHENDITFAEYGNYGDGASNSGRVSWEKKLNSQTLKTLTSMSFIDSESWVNRQPF